MPAAQTLLFPDPQPLVERLGREYFRSLPEGPGVYLMCDAEETVLYVGKAKNLRKRLGSYRVANPERLPRRHLRLLRAVARIEFEECADEMSALAREAELLRTLKPRFNRAGTWRPPPRFFVWRSELGWAQGKTEGDTVIFEGAMIEAMARVMNELFEGRVAAFGDWVRSKQRLGAPAFEQAAVVSDLEWLVECPSLSRLCTGANVR